MEIMAAHAAAPTTFRQGDRCVVNAANAGTVQFVGRLPALGPGPSERGEEGGSGSAGRARVTERCVGLWRLSGAR